MLRSVVWILQQWIQILEPELNFMKEVSVRLNSDLPVILDGAMGTQLLDRGFDLTPPLWSAEILELSAKTIEEIHKDYINVGAEIITTNTFRTTTRTFRKVFQHSIEKATEHAWNSCKIAVKAARKAAGGDIFVAGSIGPLEDCYIPELFPGEKAGLYEYNEIGKKEYDSRGYMDDPWYLAVLTAWIDDWYLGGDRNFPNSGDEDVIFEAALEAGADDFESDDNIYAIFTDPTSLMEVRDSLENSGYKIRSTEIEMIPKTLQKLDGKEAETAMKLMDALDENDDISKLYSNLDIDLESLNLE